MPRKKKGGRGKKKRMMKVRMADGSCYEGQVDRNRKPNGEGVLTLGMPAGFRFKGTFVAGLLEGHAVMTSLGGNRYEGQCVGGKMEGNGVFVFASGNRYEGQFVAGKKEGRGVYVHANGNRHKRGSTWMARWRGGAPSHSATTTRRGRARGAATAVSIGTWYFGCDGPAGCTSSAMGLQALRCLRARLRPSRRKWPRRRQQLRSRRR
jgi:hypothetical protein